MSNLTPTIKSGQDVMCQDSGVDGDIALTEIIDDEEVE